MQTVSAALSALCVAILSGLGVGSGGLLVIWLTAVMGVDPLRARGLNLLFFVFSASAALLFHVKRRRLLPRLVLWLSLFAVLGTLVGTLVGRLLDATLLRHIFGVMLVASGCYTLFGAREIKENPIFQGQASAKKSKKFQKPLYK